MIWRFYILDKIDVLYVTSLLTSSTTCSCISVINSLEYGCSVISDTKADNFLSISLDFMNDFVGGYFVCGVLGNYTKGRVAL